jgi:hypothetical protein
MLRRGKAPREKTRASASEPTRATFALCATVPKPEWGVRGPAPPLRMPNRPVLRRGKVVRQTTRASAAKRATRTERAVEAARERACGGVRGAKPRGVKKKARAPDILGPHAPPVAAPEECQACDVFRRRVASPASPVPSSNSVAGSGVFVI